ncbi:MAG TPA: hypothetical protein VHK88_11840 [Aquihabitans sp.]|jgi:hypothetical protein|nr:hypothetical protein [Aquihabitans sp.]
MTSTARHQSPTTVLAVGQPCTCLAEVEAWIDEVGPVLGALAARRSAPSAGQRRWMAEQARIAVEALLLIDAEAFEVEAVDAPCPRLGWLHVQAARALEACRVAAPEALAA